MGRELDGMVRWSPASKGGLAPDRRTFAPRARGGRSAYPPGLEEALALVKPPGPPGVYVVDLSRPDGGRDTLIADVNTTWAGRRDGEQPALGGYKPFEEWTMEQLRKVRK
jgi:hypothetical protein